MKAVAYVCFEESANDDYYVRYRIYSIGEWTNYKSVILNLRATKFQVFGKLYANFYNLPWNLIFSGSKKKISWQGAPRYFSRFFTVPWSRKRLRTTVINPHFHYSFILGMMLSLPFLLITFLVYGCIPKLQNLHGKSLMCFVFSLMMMYTSLSVVQINQNIFYTKTACKMFSYLIYLGVMLTFFWMNTMCYDIWRTFKWELIPPSNSPNTYLSWHHLWTSLIKWLNISGI